jgi:hypothetical protein
MNICFVIFWSCSFRLAVYRTGPNVSRVIRTFVANVLFTRVRLKICTSVLVDFFRAAEKMSFSKVVSNLRSTFLTGRTRDIEWRVRQLNALLKFYDDNADLFVEVGYHLVLSPMLLWFLKYFRQKIGEKWRFWLKNDKLCMQKFDHNIVFFRKTAIFSQKIGKHCRKLWL